MRIGAWAACLAFLLVIAFIPLSKPEKSSPHTAKANPKTAINPAIPALKAAAGKTPGNGSSVAIPAISKAGNAGKDVKQAVGQEAEQGVEQKVGKAIATSVPILMYHSISDNPKNLLCLSPAHFAQQMQHLKDAGYHTITFGDLDDWAAGKPIPVKPVLITFDDGYRDNYTNAFPVLKRLGLKAAIFMTTGFFDARMNLTADMAKEMKASGLIEFGSHTVSHADLTTLPDDRLRNEIFQSKSELESKLGGPVAAFCYPSGRFNEKTVQYVKKAGYRFAVTTRPGWAELSQGALTLHRIRINGDLSLKQFKEMLP